MIHLKCRTEYSFGLAYGPLAKVIEAAGGSAVGIADRGTWGHVPFFAACKKAGKKPILGARLPIVRTLEKSRQAAPEATLIALNNEGLREVYEATTTAFEQFYYTPRLLPGQLPDSPNVFILSGLGAALDKFPTKNLFVELSPGAVGWNAKALQSGQPPVATVENLYPRRQDRAAYEIVAGRNRDKRLSLMHLASEEELRAELPNAPEEAFTNSDKIAELVSVDLPQVHMVKYRSPETMEELCMRGAKLRGMFPLDKTYRARLERELRLIEEKEFNDYFFVIADMIRYAKQHMLVGPARGSSAGSLVCYFLGITDVDPIVHGLIFERFIDITRKDLPDIDIDFPDSKRELVVDYLRGKYGEQCVAHLGTVNRFKAKSAITDVSKLIGIPAYETEDLKKSIIERSTGDARAQFCIKDTFETLDVGKNLVAKYPGLLVAAEIENHARHSGVHAAGILVCNTPVKEFCTVDAHSDAAQLDKRDAEKLGALKIDILGLRTLSIIEDCLSNVGLDREKLLAIPLNDEKAFSIFNQSKFSGIFQFEGYALQSLTKQMGVHEFNDIVAITSLARPGPLHCGGATTFIKRRTGAERVTHLHEKCAPFTGETLGSIIYQEQVMEISRHVGKLDWQDVSALRKAMSKSMGDEYFNQYWEKFKAGAEENGIAPEEAKYIWDNMCTFGSWAFNKSHAVSYGLISYWCAWLKAYHPLEFAAANLRNIREEDSAIKLLRELVREGYQYKPFDPERSAVDWSVQEGMLIGGLTAIKGVGEKTAKDILYRRQMDMELTPSQKRLLTSGKTPWEPDYIFEGERRFGDYYLHPEKHGILSGHPVYIKDINTRDGTYIFLARLKEKNLRDMNEYGSVVKRGGKLITRNNLFLNMMMEDDTDNIICTVGRFDYAKYGKPIVENAAVGDWFLVKGTIKKGYRKIIIEKIKKLTNKGDSNERQSNIESGGLPAKEA